uniref:Small ribosomal subunit protein uS7c n=2 Tax=Batophora TaxID=3139 RepID=A0A386JM01_9CHLO|nr:30S ribosomal protein S7 [Batophora oerstedii]AYD72466.1 30S ribosomal protein S7 [Batophora occidentalis]
MSRRRTPKKRFILSDPNFNNQLVTMIVNRLMKKGKKSLAYKIIYKSMQQIGDKTNQDPILILSQAVRNVTPLVEVKARRIGGSNYQVPIEVDPERGTALAIRWILAACRTGSGKTLLSKLTNELLEASKNSGSAIRKKDEVHKMAEANKAFAKYRF